MSTIRIVAVDDHDLILKGMDYCFAHQADMELVATGMHGDEIFPLIQSHHPDVILLDYKLPSTQKSTKKDFNILPAIQKLKREHADLHVMVVSAHHDSILIKRCLDAGASGFFSKSDSQDGFDSAIRAVMQNGQYLSAHAAREYATAPLSILTPRQGQVLQLIEKYPATSYEELAQMLTISESTFKKHLTEAMRRLDSSNNRLAAIQKAKELNLI